MIDAQGNIENFDQCIIGAHAPDALQMLGTDATDDEQRILSAFKYSHRWVIKMCYFLICFRCEGISVLIDDFLCSDVFLHRDTKFMPKNSAAWCAWNFLGCSNDNVCVTYWLNKLQVR